MSNIIVSTNVTNSMIRKSPFLHFSCTLACTVALSGCLALTSQSAAAQIFRTVDAEGNVTYTDQAPNTQDRRVIAEKIEITPPNTFQDSTPYERWEGNETTAQEGEANYELSIVSPTYDQALRENSGNIVIRSQINPELQEGHVLRLELNGSLTGDPVEGGSIYLTNVSRGTHRARLVVENEKGRRIAESPESVFHLQRFSQLSPAARARRANAN